MPDITGSGQYQLDPKGRMSLPSKVRRAFEEGLTITLGVDGCLWAFPPAQWQRSRDRITALPITSPESRWYRRMFLGNAESVELDSQGRLVIPQRLRQEVGIDREVTVIGNGDHLEIWATDTWERASAPFHGQYIAGTLPPEGT